MTSSAIPAQHPPARAGASPVPPDRIDAVAEIPSHRGRVGAVVVPAPPSCAGTLALPLEEGGGGPRTRPAPPNAPAVRFDGVDYAYDGRPALSGVGIEAPRRGPTAVVGRSGADRAVIVAEHRPPTVREADHIVALDRGRVVGRGSHEEPAAASPAYRALPEGQGAAPAGA
ncbi:hypothetical protein SAMN05421803_106172 [Nocardiopsis flavescens]|uniref:Uncharacterized protein n=1 Tax=Nocardiopsis flavescens TaxID=758803 RepID=A0A1M6JKK9_9ACTN|nr:hypothetical protein [Nocardiopsis flavescens]SHJ47220.1 hypothetical protein SAMN05421803_106172 [Nocardiopsis flavescens]